MPTEFVEQQSAQFWEQILICFWPAPLAAPGTHFAWVRTAELQRLAAQAREEAAQSPELHLPGADISHWIDNISLHGSL